jgi:hypothetical protein
LGVGDCLGEGEGLAFLGRGLDGVTIVLAFFLLLLLLLVSQGTLRIKIESGHREINPVRGLW